MAEAVQWEYRVVTFGGALRSAKDEQMESELNALGEEGWEVVGLTKRESTYRITLIAKRPLTAATRRQRSLPGENW
jgi:hypothetical protein